MYVKYIKWVLLETLLLCILQIIGSFLMSCTQNSVWEGGAWLSGVWHSNICQWKQSSIFRLFVITEWFITAVILLVYFVWQISLNTLTAITCSYSFHTHSYTVVCWLQNTRTKATHFRLIINITLECVRKIPSIY